MKETKTCTKCGVTDRLEKFVGKQNAQKRGICRLCNNFERNEKRTVDKAPTVFVILEGDGPCWCCRNQAVGETAYRLCVICLG